MRAWISRSMKARVTAPATAVTLMITALAYALVVALWPPLAIPLAILGLAVVGLVATTTWISIGHALRPVEEIRARLDEITESNLSGRVPTPPTEDEIADLAASVNATLDRLEEAVVSNKNFVANASHELRSPLAALRSMTEVAVLHPDQVDRHGTLESILDDVARLETLVSDLLLLARLDARRMAGPATGSAADQAVDATEVVRREVARRPRRVQVTTLLPEHAVVRGNELGLGRLLVNLLDNAERHAESKVRVRAWVEDADVLLDVTDDGPGVDPTVREWIFQRFTRLAHEPGQESTGSGLGLPLAREIAMSYGGALTVEDSDTPESYGGARFVLRVPLTS